MYDSGRPAYDLQCRPITHALANAPVTDQSSRESPLTNNSAQTYSHAKYLRVIRPPDIVCRRTFLPVFLSFVLLFFRRLISEVAERNSTKIGHMVGSKCNLKTHVRNPGYPLDPPTNRGHLFGRLRNLTATLTAYIFGTKHDIDNRSCALTTTRGLLHRIKMS